MELEYFGGNCVKITTKKASIVIDDTLDKLGLKGIIKPKDITLYTTKQDKKVEAQFTIDSPGEYEVSSVSVQGIGARAHMDEDEKSRNATMYRLVIDDMRVAVVGHVYPELSDEQLEAFGMIDVLFVPVGGSGYTLDGIGALKIIKKIEPKIVIPTHYGEKGINYEVPQAELDEAIKGLGMEISETADSLKLKSSDLGEGMRLIVLKRK